MITRRFELLFLTLLFFTRRSYAAPVGSHGDNLRGFDGYEHLHPTFPNSGVQSEDTLTGSFSGYGADEDYHATIDSLFVHQHPPPSLASVLESGDSLPIPHQHQEPFRHGTPSPWSANTPTYRDAFESGQTAASAEYYPTSQLWPIYSSSQESQLAFHNTPASQGQPGSGHAQSGSQPDSFEGLSDSQEASGHEARGVYEDDQGIRDENQEEEEMEADDEEGNVRRVEARQRLLRSKKGKNNPRPTTREVNWTDFYRHLSKAEKRDLLDRYMLVLGWHEIKQKRSLAYDRIANRCDHTAAQNLFSDEYYRQVDALRVMDAFQGDDLLTLRERKEANAVITNEFGYTGRGLTRFYSTSKKYMDPSIKEEIKKKGNKTEADYVDLAHKLMDGYKLANRAVVERRKELDRLKKQKWQG